MANLLDSIQQHLSSELISRAASVLGETENDVLTALKAWAPTILTGLWQKTGDSVSMGSIFNLLSNADSGILDDLGSLVDGGNLAHNDPKDDAGNLLGVLFGSKVPALTNAIAAFSGLKSSSASSLLGVVGPLIMSVLGSKIGSEGLNVSGLANVLVQEKDHILGALPSGLASVLGLVQPGTPAAASTNSTSGDAATGTNWLWPLLLLLALGGGIIYYMKHCTAPIAKPSDVEAPQEIDSAAVAAAHRADSAQLAASVYTQKLSSGFEIKGNLNGIESQLLAFIEDNSKPVDKTTWFNFDRLTFNTGSAVIDMDKSREQLTNIYEILKAYPKVKLKIGGYTDNVGGDTANMKLSTERAKATVAALEGMGIEKGRLSPEGYGSQHPVASNDTEEGRAQNRRIAVRVTAK